MYILFVEFWERCISSISPAARIVSVVVRNFRDPFCNDEMCGSVVVLSLDSRSRSQVLNKTFRRVLSSPHLLCVLLFGGV